MEIFKILLPLFYGIFPIVIALRMQLPAKKKRKDYIEKQQRYRFAKGKVLNVDRKGNDSKKGKELLLYTVDYEFLAEDGKVYQDTYRYSSSKKELDFDIHHNVAIYYDPADPDNHYTEQEVALCEKKIKDSYTIFYCGILSAILLIVFLNVAL